jgi:hypothetical protein
MTGDILDLCVGAAPADDPVCFDFDVNQQWGVDRRIRAEVLRHLLVMPQWLVHARGIRLRGARIVGPLDLQSATLRCPLVLQDCYLEDPVVLDYATTALLRLVHCWLAGFTADFLIVTKELDLSRSTVDGAVRMLGASITGRFICSGAQITGTDIEGNALVADNTTVGGGVFLDGGFLAAGAVRLHGAGVTGQLNCGGAQITGSNADGDALIADSVTVGGTVLLARGFSAAGAVRLHGAAITGQLDCRGAQITGKNSDGNALMADGVTVSLSALLGDGFTAAGAVRLLGADITGALNCNGAKITDTDSNGNALVADGLRVGGHVLFNDSFMAAGAVRLSVARIDGGLELRDAILADPVAFVADGARIGQQLVWAPARAVTGEVNLERTQLHRLDDDWQRVGAFWPEEGKLRLAGFVYDGFGGEHQATGDQRLGWIRAQHRKPVPGDAGKPGQPGIFDAQPYEQLARVYRQAGQDTQARRIAIAQRSDLRTYASLGLWRFAGNLFLDVTIKHGYKPLRAIGGLLAVYAVAFGLFWGAQHQDAVMVPARDTSPLHAAPTATDCTQNYPCFSPAGYAIDVSIPIIKTGQADSWRPNAAAHLGWVYVGGSWVFTALGWAFTTLAIAGYTGLIRKD